MKLPHFGNTFTVKSSVDIPVEKCYNYNNCKLIPE